MTEIKTMKCRLAAEAALAGVFNNKYLEVDNMNEIKEYEEVKCELCGSQDIDQLEEFEEIAYSCNDCGFEWGNWEQHTERSREKDAVNINTDVETLDIEKVKNMIVDFKEIDKDSYNKSIDDLRSKEEVLLTPQTVIDFGKPDGKPTEIKSKLMMGKVDSVEFFVRMDLWNFSKEINAHKVKSTLTMSLTDSLKFGPYFAIILLQVQAQANYAGDGEIEAWCEKQK